MNRCCTWHCLCRSCESVGSSDSLDSLLDESARFNFDTELSRDCLQFAAKMFRYEFSGFFCLQLVGVRVFIHLLTYAGTGTFENNACVGRNCF